MEEERLNNEIEQMVREHRRWKVRGRITWAFVGAAALVLVLLFAGFDHWSQKADGAGPYAAIAGLYKLVDIEVYDPFDIPRTYPEAGACVIDAKGNIEFPYYYREPDEDGGFGMLKGTLQQNDYPLHHYKIMFDQEDAKEIYLYNMCLDVEEDGVRVIENGSSSTRGGGTIYRYIDLVFTKDETIVQR